MRDVLVRDPLRLELEWRAGELWHVDLDWAAKDGEEDSVRQSPFAGEAAAFFRAWARGDPPGTFPFPLAWHRAGGFARRVLTVLADRVGRGQWISYSGLARLCGVPRGARAVGRVMGANPWPIVIPCHRVLRSDGGIGGFSSGIELKRYLLSLEEVAPALSGRARGSAVG